MERTRRYLIDSTPAQQKLDEQMGYQCAGELLADSIQYTLHGEFYGEGAKHKKERYQNYLQNTDSVDIQQAAGVASTLDDGIEIIPTLLPGIRERGPGTFQPILDAFRPVQTARKEVDFLINEDQYNIPYLTLVSKHK